MKTAHLLAALALALASAASGAAELNADEAKQLARCFRTAERYHFALESRSGGVTRDELLARIDKALGPRAATAGKEMRQAVEEVYADAPQDPGSYLRAQAEHCVGEEGFDAAAPLAGKCYDLTLFAKQVFRAKRRGLALEQVKAETRKQGPAHDLTEPQVEQLDKVAEAVYVSRLEEERFRAVFFLRCVSRAR